MATTMPAAQKIEIPYPHSGQLELLLRLGPCRFTVRPADGPAWISGTYDDPTGVLPLDVAVGPRTAIKQRVDFTAFSGAAIPRLDLAISRERPFVLDVEVGANDSLFDFGGLPLSRLAVKTGASRSEIDFSQPNPTVMSLLELSTGAGAFTAKRLANANFTGFRFGGGVAACALDFGGTLLRDSTARVDAGLGSVDISVPATTAVRVRSKSFASAVQAGGAFSRIDDTYGTPPVAQGAHPLLEIDASLAFGGLNLTTT